MPLTLLVILSPTSDEHTVDAKTTPLFQGRDWVTSRWSMAEAFDTLDHIHDLCVCFGWNDSEGGYENHFEAIPNLMALTDDLRGHLAVAVADTIPHGRSASSFEHLWMCFEIEQIFEDIVTKVTDLADDEAHSPLGTMALLASRLKDELKKMDQ